MEKAKWRRKFERWRTDRFGLIEAKETEFVAGFIENFRPIYCITDKIDGEHWLVWFLKPDGAYRQIVQEITPGTYLDWSGSTIIEHDPDELIVSGSVSRIGDPLPISELIKMRSAK